MNNTLVDRIDNFLLKAKRYIQPEKGERPPEGVAIKTGPKEGKYYETSPGGTKLRTPKAKSLARDIDLMDSLIDDGAKKAYDVLVQKKGYPAFHKILDITDEIKDQMEEIHAPDFKTQGFDGLNNLFNSRVKAVAIDLQEKLRQRPFLWRPPH